MRVFVSTIILGFTLSAVSYCQVPNRVSPVDSGANLPAQSIGANDLLSISVYNAPELTRTIRVGGDGTIRIPMLKQRIKAESKFPGEIEAAIARALFDENVLVDPVVTVTVAEYHSRPISVSGAVKFPLVFQAEKPTTLLEALAKAQGLREDAGQEILVSHTQPGPDGAPITITRRVAVRGLIDGADPLLNVKLTGGEEIRVPEVDKIYVVGNIKKSGAFPVQGGAETTVLQMLALAEGLLPFTAQNAYIYRRDAKGAKNEIPIPLTMIMKRKSPDVPLFANDILYIPDNSGRRMTLTALDRIATFGSSTASGLLIWRR
jgi:polysaccharide export outer membrane protein